MRNKLLLTILLTLATASNAATVYSPTNVLPLTATYNAEKFQYCSVDSSAPLPSANFPTSLNDFSIGRYTFTADNSHGGSTSSAAFSAWLKYWTTVYPALQSPLTLMASTLDPTSTSLPQAYLKETPIWWGTLSDAKTVSKLTYPFSSSLALTNNPFTGGLIFVTSYNYALPSNNGNVATAYAVYAIDPANVNNPNWGRSLAYLNKVSLPTNIITQSVFIQPVTLGTTSYNFNCIGKLNLTQ